ncbi:hypothetical protein LguiB_009064 [Lonicera macranthoides]
MGSKGENSLPEELMMEIIWRLPVKYLLRFKSVCKNWYDLIQNPNFIYNHYNHPNNHTCLLLHHHLFKLIMLDPKSEVRYRICASEFSLLSNETHLNMIPEDMVSPQTPCDCQLFNIIGPVNGLFFMYYDHQLALWNPATTEFRVLALPHDFDFCYHSRFGFGLDSLTGDFKVVCIPYVGGDGLGLLVQLYSLANDSWRLIDSVSASSLAHICTEVWHTRYLNGAYYWLSCTRPGPTVVIFDMGTEVFREIQTPLSFKSESLTTYNEEVGRLVLFNNSIALLETHYSNDDIIESIDVWVMKEDECWIKHSSIVGLPNIPFFRPLGFWTNGELLFHENDNTGGHTSDSELVLYNPNNRKIQVLGNCTEVLNYKASLASVKGGSKFCQTSYDSTSNNKKRKRIALTEERY